MTFRKCFHPDLLWGLGLLLLLSLPFLFTDLDLALAAAFYNHGWGAGDRQPWAALYRYGTLPGLLVSIVALGVYLLSWLRPSLLPWRRPAAIIVLTLLLGPGLLVNALGKGYWGRPRPRDVAQFGGSENFHRLQQPGIPGQGKSFPCGHASVGFLLVVFYFLDANQKRRWAWLGVGFGFGTLMGVARMAQGGHFASDVLWAGGLTYLSAAFTHHVLLPRRGHNPQDLSRLPLHLRGLVWLGLILGMAGLTAFFLVATPYSKEWKGAYDPSATITAVRIEYASASEQVKILQRPQANALEAEAVLHGFGFPKLHLIGEWQAETRGNTLNARLDFKFDRWITERKGKVTIYVNEGLRVIP